MTAAELVAAVQPCLPLPGIEVGCVVAGSPNLSKQQVGYKSFDGQKKYIWLHPRTFSNMVKGAIADACAESRWSVMQGLATTHIDIYDNNVPVVLAPRKSYHAHGTDAIAWCKAYAQACEKGGAA